MDPRTQTDSETIQEELVAYLDGELSAEQSSRIEQLLSSEAKYREQLQQLQQAWDMLDLLPRAEVSDAFTQSTVEMVAVKAADQVNQEHLAISRRFRVAWVAAAASVLAAALVGYVVTRWIVAAPNRQLVRDLPVIENVDLYYNVDNIDFLRRLEQSGLFNDDVEEPGDAS